MNSPTHRVHLKLSRALSHDAAQRSQQIWVLIALVCLTTAVLLNNILGKIVGSNFIRALQVGAALFLIAMLLASLLPMKDNMADGNKSGVLNRRSSSSSTNSPRYYDAATGRVGNGQGAATPRTPQYQASSSSSSSSGMRNASTGASSINRGSGSFLSHSAAATPASSSRLSASVSAQTPSFASPVSVASASTPMSAVSPAVSVRVSTGGSKRRAPESSHLFDANFQRDKKVSRVAGDGVAARGGSTYGYGASPGVGKSPQSMNSAGSAWQAHSGSTGGHGVGSGSYSGSGLSQASSTSPAAYYSQQSYNESPAIEARMSHVLDNGLMLVTKNAFHALESRDETRRFSYGEIDSWIEGVRKVLYNHIRAEMGLIDKLVPQILHKVCNEMGITRQSEREGLSNLLRGLSSSCTVGQPAKELSHGEALSTIERHFERDAELRLTLNRYKHSAIIFQALRVHDKRTTAKLGRERPSLAVASVLRSVVAQRRLPLEATHRGVNNSGAGSNSYYRGWLSGDSSGVDTASVVMSVFSHYWDSRSRKAQRSGNFSMDHYASSTIDLHGLLRHSVAIVRNEQLPFTHFDVFSALDDRDGPVILEVDEGRHNPYVAILMFLLNIYKCSKPGSHQAHTLPATEVRSVLEHVCKGRYRSNRTDNDAALEEYLDQFINM